jgi:rRNA maturation RNase YbeY
MISFNYETDFELPYEQEYSLWISKVISSEGRKEGEINYIFCDDLYLLEINQKYLGHDTFTDIISFDYSVGKELHGDIYISVERVKENAKEFEVDFKEEIRRVMVHGILHYCGYKDKSDKDKMLMRSKEDSYINQSS